MGERGWELRCVRGWFEGVAATHFLRTSAERMLRTLRRTVRAYAEKRARPRPLRGDTNTNVTLSPPSPQLTFPSSVTSAPRCQVGCSGTSHRKTSSDCGRPMAWYLGAGKAARGGVFELEWCGVRGVNFGLLSRRAHHGRVFFFSASHGICAHTPCAPVRRKCGPTGARHPTCARHKCHQYPLSSPQPPQNRAAHAPHLLVLVGIHLRPQVLRVRGRVPVVEEALVVVRPGKRRKLGVVQLIWQFSGRAGGLVDAHDVDGHPVAAAAAEECRGGRK